MPIVLMGTLRHIVIMTIIHRKFQFFSYLVYTANLERSIDIQKGSYLYKYKGLGFRQVHQNPKSILFFNTSTGTAWVPYSIISSTGSLPRYLEQLVIGQVRGHKLNVDLPHGCQGAMYINPNQLPVSVHPRKKQNIKWKTQTQVP